jgi:hypothetical protein
VSSNYNGNEIISANLNRCNASGNKTRARFDRTPISRSMPRGLWKSAALPKIEESTRFVKVQDL